MEEARTLCNNTGKQKEKNDKTDLEEIIYEDGGRGKVRRHLSEDRKTWKYYVFGFLTCGIYQWYVIYSLASDINEACEGDGKTTSGLLKYVLFSLCTCGIYTYVWNYKFMKRIQDNSGRYDFDIKTFAGMDLGSCWLVLSILGTLITACGIGAVLSIYAEYLLFTNMNALCAAYNRYYEGINEEDSYQEEYEEN